jgi:hypothetical protein
MENLALVKSLKTSDDLDEDVPDFLLFDVGLSFLITAYFLKDIAVVSVFHDQT